MPPAPDDARGLVLDQIAQVQGLVLEVARVVLEVVQDVPHEELRLLRLADDGPFLALAPQTLLVGHQGGDLVEVSVLTCHSNTNSRLGQPSVKGKRVHPPSLNLGSTSFSQKMMLATTTIVTTCVA